MIIAVGGSPNEQQFDCVERPIQSCFEYLEVDCVSTLFINRVDEKGAILQHPDALERAFRLGGELASSREPVPEEPARAELF